MQRQLEDCTALADRLGWEIVAHFDDNDISAYSGKRRKGFEALLKAMASSDVDAVICWHTDRLYRHMADLESVIEIADEHGIELRTVQAGTIDLSTSTGRMLARILGATARQESEHKAERHRRANEQKAAAGRWQTAWRPFGYTMDGEPLEPEASMLRQAAADILTGKSVRQVAREWNAAGITGSRGTKFNSPHVRRLLINPRYAALRVHRGKVVGPGDWPAIIDVDTHHGLVAFLTDPARISGTGFERKYQGSGVYICGVCGGLMRHSVASAASGAAKGYRRYECADHQHVGRSGEPVDHMVTSWVIEYLSRPDARLPLTSGHESSIAELHNQRIGLQARLDELAGIFADGAINGSQLRRGTADLRTDLAAVDAELAELSRISPAAAILSDSAEIAEHWQQLTQDERAAIITELVSALSPDMRGKLIHELCTVRINPTWRGSKFRPEDVDIRPKAGE